MEAKYIEINVDQLDRVFKAGKQAGIKEVNDELNKLAKEFEVSLFRDVIQSPLWQSKLRDWGIERSEP